MEKARIYELAKELNTTSKRLMEKLAEINVNVKNHMSLLEPHELDALYKHIGVIRHDDKKNEVGEKKTVAESTNTVAEKKKEVKKEVKKDNKSAPRIIRTTEIILDSKTDDSSQSNNFSKNETKNVQKKNYRNDYVKVESSTSGLRPGFVRDVKQDFKNKQNSAGNRNEAQKIVPKEAPAPKEEILNNSKINQDIHKEEKIVADNKGNESKVLNDSSNKESAQLNNKVAAAEKEGQKSISKPESAQPSAQPEIKPQQSVGTKKPEETGSSGNEESHGKTEKQVTAQNGNSSVNNVPVTERPVQRTDRPQGHYN
ncbi:translation initiation factor IF-2 N-terminal domain-containing protein, partial [Ruminiclostridium papyrosolvens]|uniref:translation initiation factor IF-2 N-terminal domain-containing protein n=1 Tax=Ruminiclostridium papyrosolvens TaxID=29362 RepID=UPI0004CE5D1E